MSETLLLTEVCDRLGLNMHLVRILIDQGDLTPVYFVGTSPFNIRAARFSAAEVDLIAERFHRDLEDPGY